MIHHLWAACLCCARESGLIVTITIYLNLNEEKLFNSIFYLPTSECFASVCDVCVKNTKNLFAYEAIAAVRKTSIQFKERFAL